MNSAFSTAFSIRSSHNFNSSREKTSARLHLLDLCLILSNFPESALPTLWLGESGVIKSGNRKHRAVVESVLCAKLGVSDNSRS